MVADTDRYTQNNEKENRATWKSKQKKNKWGVRLTGMAGRTRITSVCTVTGEGVPGLGAFTLVFTVAGKTPKRRQT